jgi:excisionase family DNA binding protein
LPPTLFDVLRQVGEALANGRGVSVIPQESKLTTQSAADFLGISRPTRVKLLESGQIRFEKVGRHRRVTLRDLLQYRDRFRAQRRVTLRKLAPAGQKADCSS